MTVIHPSLFKVIKRFPERRDEIRHLLDHSEVFRNMCEDYRQCKEAILYWSDQGSEESLVRTSEYMELLQDLETEITTCLNINQLSREA